MKIRIQTWQELRDPLTNETIDFAFVIVPEPTAAMLLGLGLLGVLRRRRRYSELPTRPIPC